MSRSAGSSTPTPPVAGLPPHGGTASLLGRVLTGPPTTLRIGANVTDHPEELAAFRETFLLDELTVQEGERWVLSTRPGQITLGSMVISHRAGALDFASLVPGDGQELTDWVASAEDAAKALYGAVRLNVVCLMMMDPVVHFHVLPRYAVPVERHGRTWTDDDWPGAPTFAPVPTREHEQRAIRDELRAQLG